MPARVTEDPQRIDRTRQRMHDAPARDRRTDSVKVVLERSGDSKVSSTSANGPEQSAHRVGACAKPPAVRRDDNGGTQIVQRETVLRHEPSDPAAKSETGDPGGADAAGAR